MPHFNARLRKNQFRLFRLKQHSRTDDIEIEVKTFKIYRAPKYEAIHTARGDKSDGTTIIRCNGKPLEASGESLCSPASTASREYQH